MIIGNGRPAGEGFAWFSGHAAGSPGKSPAASPKLAHIGLPTGQVLDSHKISTPAISPADAALLACLAGRAAASEELIARMVPQIRSLLARNPLAAPARVARLVLETELRGIAATAGGLDGLLSLDGFGQTVLDKNAADTNPDPDSGKGKDRSMHSLPEGQSTDLEINTILDGLARPQPGRPGWHWFSLGGTDWSSGGSLRIALAPSGRLVNLDVKVAEGCWQFHWSEPRRNRLYFARPEGGENRFRLPKCLSLLQEAIGPLGFGDFVEMNPKDWYDGFTYLPSTSIISRVDIVT